MTWLKNRTRDHRPEVKSLSCMVYAERFPRQVRNQKKQELSIQTLKLNIGGEICDSFGDPVYVKESYQVSRTPPAIVRIQQDGSSQTIAPPSKILAKLLKWTVRVKYSNGEIQDTKSADDMPGHVLELLSALAELFE